MIKDGHQSTAVKVEKRFPASFLRREVGESGLGGPRFLKNQSRCTPLGGHWEKSCSSRGGEVCGPLPSSPASSPNEPRPAYSVLVFVSQTGRQPGCAVSKQRRTVLWGRDGSPSEPYFIWCKSSRSSGDVKQTSLGRDAGCQCG